MYKVLLFIFTLAIAGFSSTANAADFQYEKAAHEDSQREKLKHQDVQRDNVRHENFQRENIRREDLQRDNERREDSQREKPAREDWQRANARNEMVRHEDYQDVKPGHDYYRRAEVRREVMRRIYAADNWASSERPGYTRIDYQPRIPYGWNEDREDFREVDYYPVERTHRRHLPERFPVLNPYGWYSDWGYDFWYHGQHITNAAVFYDDSEEHVGIAFWQDGMFVMIHDEDNNVGNSDSFFLMYSTLRVPGEESGVFLLV